MLSNNAFYAFLRTTCLALVAFLAGGAQSEAQIDRILAAHIPPVMIEGEDSSPGYAIEVLQLASEVAGRKIDIEFLPIQRAIHELGNDKSSIFPSLFRTPAREDVYQWIAPLRTIDMHFITLGDTLGNLDTARKLGNIAVSAGGAPDAVLTDLGFENLVRVQNPDAAALMLTNRRVDAWFTSSSVAGAFKSDNQDTTISPPIFKLSTFIAAHPDFPADAAQEYRDALNKLRANSALGEIAKKYNVDFD